MVPRVDISHAMKMISVVIDNKRVTAEDWGDMAPMWKKEDVVIGKDYTSILRDLGVEHVEDLSPQQLARLCNSDTMSDDPYGKPELRTAYSEWATLVKQSKETIPICVVGEGDQDEMVLGGRIAVGARQCEAAL